LCWSRIIQAFKGSNKHYSLTFSFHKISYIFQFQCPMPSSHYDDKHTYSKLMLSHWILQENTVNNRIPKIMLNYRPDGWQLRRPLKRLLVKDKHTYQGLIHEIIIIIIIIIVVSCHRPFLPGTSLEPAVIPNAQASRVTLQYFPYYVWCSKYSCLL
jgi:hypothetical protein